MRVLKGCSKETGKDNNYSEVFFSFMELIYIQSDKNIILLNKYPVRLSLFLVRINPILDITRSAGVEVPWTERYFLVRMDKRGYKCLSSCHQRKGFPITPQFGLTYYHLQQSFPRHLNHLQALCPKTFSSLVALFL